MGEPVREIEEIPPAVSVTTSTGPAIAIAAPPADEEPPSPPAIELSGYAQVDLQSLAMSDDQLSDGTNRPLNEDRFLVRRARVRVDGNWRWLGFLAESSFSTSGGASLGVSQVEVFAQIPGSTPSDPPLVRLGAGLFAVPFGYEIYEQGNTQRLFTERSLMAQAFVPGEFDVGVRLSGAVRWIRWAIAVQNGEPIGERSFPTVDPNSAKDISARVGSAIDITSWLHVSVGLSALTGKGFHPGTAPTKDTLVWRDFNEDGIVTLSELTTIRGVAATPSESFDRWGLSGDLQLRADLPVLGALTLFGELATALNLDRAIAPSDPVELGRDERARGFYLALTQEIGEHLVAGARYDYYEPNLDALDVSGGQTVLARRPFKTFTVALSGRLRLIEGVTGRAIAELATQDNALGRDAAGRPASVDNDVLRMRLEVSF
jgi:hypothetical protein